MTAPQIAEIVRENDGTVRTWLRRYEAEGTEGLSDRPRSGGPSKVTPAFVEELLAAVRKRPRGLDLPFSLWSCQRLADYLAELTGLQVSDETIRRQLAEHGITLSRPQHKVSVLDRTACSVCASTGPVRSPDPEYEVKKRRLKRRETI